MSNVALKTIKVEQTTKLVNIQQSMNVEAATRLEEHVELLQFVDTEGRLCDNGSDLKQTQQWNS